MARTGNTGSASPCSAGSPPPAAAPPSLFVRQRASGAYLRMATDQISFRPCMDAIFGNPALVARFGAARLAAIRRRAEAENCWIIGRELVRHGRAARAAPGCVARRGKAEPQARPPARRRLRGARTAVRRARPVPYLYGLRPAVAPTLSPATGAARPLSS